MIAQLNGWDEITQAMELATSLNCAARSVLTDIDAQHRQDYSQVVKALVNRFEPDNQSEVYRAQLKIVVGRGSKIWLN